MADCLATQLLISQIQKKQKTNKSNAHIEKEIQEHVFSIRQGARQDFYARAPWQEEHVTDQYYFDLTNPTTGSVDGGTTGGGPERSRGPSPTPV